MQYTPDDIDELLPHQIIVFGSNFEGRHGKGLALTCLKRFGAKYGQSRGLQGQCYAIITKDLKLGKRSVSLEFIAQQIQDFIVFAQQHPEFEFLFTKIGTKNAGFSERELENILKKFEFPKNVRLPKFVNHLDQWFDVLV